MERLWQGSFFYCPSALPGGIDSGLPAFSTVSPVFSQRWGAGRLDDLVKVDVLRRRLSSLVGAGLTGLDLMVYWMLCRVQPLQSRIHKLCHWTGKGDPTRIYPSGIRYVQLAGWLGRVSLHRLPLDFDPKWKCHTAFSPAPLLFARQDIEDPLEWLNSGYEPAVESDSETALCSPDGAAEGGEDTAGSWLARSVLDSDLLLARGGDPAVARGRLALGGYGPSLPDGVASKRPRLAPLTGSYALSSCSELVAWLPSTAAACVRSMELLEAALECGKIDKRGVDSSTIAEISDLQASLEHARASVASSSSVEVIQLREAVEDVKATNSKLSTRLKVSRRKVLSLREEIHLARVAHDAKLEEQDRAHSARMAGLRDHLGKAERWREARDRLLRRIRLLEESVVHRRASLDDALRHLAILETRRTQLASQLDRGQSSHQALRGAVASLVSHAVGPTSADVAVVPVESRLAGAGLLGRDLLGAAQLLCLSL